MSRSQADGAPASAGTVHGNERGLELQTAPTAAPQSGPMTPALAFARGRYARRIGVTIGIDAYEGPIPRLDAAVSDAKRMAQLFRDMGFDEIVSVEDKGATRAALVDLIGRRLPSMAGPNDLVVVFFAGHGHTVGQMGYVLPQDATKKIAESGLSVQELKEAALRTKAPHVLFLVDACFSGSMFRKGAPEREENDRAYWEANEKKRVVQIVTAGGADEKVLESGGWGAFTRAIHEGLAQAAADANRDGVVTLEELARYADARVTRDTGGAQHPQWGTVEGSGTVLLWDTRRLPADQRAARASRPLVAGLEAPLRRVHELIDKRAWSEAERAVRDLLLKSSHVELHLLLAEVYLGADPLGNASLIDAELRRAEGASPTEEEQKRLYDLRARLERTRRGPL